MESLTVSTILEETGASNMLDVVENEALLEQYEPELIKIREQIIKEIQSILAENKEIKSKKPKSSLIGNQAKPAVLDSTTKLDIDTKKILVDNIIDAGLSHKLDSGALENFTSISNSRDQIYTLIDTMSQDSSVAAILRTYAEDVCEPADNGHVIWCEANDPQISKFVNYILNTMNADKNMYGWTYTLLKYGDLYLRLYRESDYDDPLFKSNSIDQAYSARNVLNEDLQEKLEAAGFELTPRSNKEVMDKLIASEESRYVRKLVNLICRFITNFKTNG